MAPFAVLCLALLLSGLGFGEGFTRVSLPIPVEVEGQSIRCGLYFKLEMKTYNVPFDKFATGAREKAETMFVTAVEALRASDTAKFATVWTAPDGMNSRGGATVKMDDDSPAGWIKLARSNYDFDHLMVVAEVLLGPDSMFVFDSNTQDGIQRYALYVGLDKKGQLRLSAVGSNTPLELLVLNSFVEARTSPEQYKPLPNINLRYQYPIPLAGRMDSGPHPVFFEFGGLTMDFNLSNDKLKPPMPVLTVYRQAEQALANKKYNELPSYYTEASQAKVKEWLAATQNQLASQLQTNQKNATNPASPAKAPTPLPVKLQNVKFVIDADPLFLIFQAPGLGNDWKPASLSYVYVVHQGGDYKIANFLYSAALDDFLQDPSLFDKNVLKPVPPKPGAVQAKPAPATAKPVGVKH